MESSLMATLERMLVITELLAQGDGKLTTEQVETLADAYDRVNAWLGSGTAFPRDIYAERMAMAAEYDMGEEMI